MMALESPDPSVAGRPAVIFDLDGVLVITEALKAQAHEETVQFFGGRVERGFYGLVMGRFARISPRRLHKRGRACYRAAGLFRTLRSNLRTSARQ